MRHSFGIYAAYSHRYQHNNIFCSHNKTDADIMFDKISGYDVVVVLLIALITFAVIYNLAGGKTRLYIEMFAIINAILILVVSQFALRNNIRYPQRSTSSTDIKSAPDAADDSSYQYTMELPPHLKNNAHLSADELEQKEIMVAMQSGIFGDYNKSARKRATNVSNTFDMARMSDDMTRFRARNAPTVRNDTMTANILDQIEESQTYYGNTHETWWMSP
jgi:hypothetical protein